MDFSREDYGYLHGRYNEDRPRQAYQLTLLGCDEKEMAKVIGVERRTIVEWMKKHEDFRQAIEEAGTLAQAQVSASLYKRAVGFWYTAQKVVSYKGETEVVEYREYVPPDPWSAHKILSARRPQDWSTTQRIETTQTNININKLDMSDITTEELELLHRIGMKRLTKDVGDS